MTRTIEKTRYGTLPSTISLKIREPGSALTHFAALVLLTAGSGPLMIHAKESGSRLTMVGAAIFLMTSCLLYAASTCYHTVVLDERRTTIFRKMDHISIAIMIAGSYTPLTLIVFRGVLGWVMFGVIWFAAILGVVLNSINVERFKKFSMITYVLMGWAVIVTLGPLVKSVATGGVTLLAVGGIMYTVGIVFYKLQKKVRYMHSIWHLFVIAGALFQFFGIFFYILL